MPRYRHIVRLANRQWQKWFPWGEAKPIFAALQPGNYATIANYLERKLGYMDAGDEAQERQLGRTGPDYL
jgi:hypothetical protein